jgi:predicted RNA binding protein YcfA (HicA-like mRNA interferase family)
LSDLAKPSASFPFERDRGGRREMKVRDAIRLLEEDGWFLVATRGSHRQFKHRAKPGRVTIAGKPSDDIAPGTLNSIMKQASLKEIR